MHFYIPRTSMHILESARYGLWAGEYVPLKGLVEYSCKSTSGSETRIVWCGLNS